MKLFLSFQGTTILVSQNQIYDLLHSFQQSPEFYLLSQGRVCSIDEKFENNQSINVICKLIGGKGGFGAKLKTEGGKKVRPNENMFSRDLQGQPIAYSTINRQYQQFYRRRTIENQRVEKQLKDFQVVSNTYKQDYVSSKLDSTYNAEIQENQKRLKEGLKIGMKKYLEKKKNEVQGEEKKSQQSQEKKEKQREEQPEEDEHEQDLVQEQLSGTKRSTPIGYKDEEEGAVTKRIKLNPSEQKEQEQKKQKANNPKPQNEKILSARDKLKSLFKK